MSLKLDVIKLGYFKADQPNIVSRSPLSQHSLFVGILQTEHLRCTYIYQKRDNSKEQMWLFSVSYFGIEFYNLSSEWVLFHNTLGQ